MLLVNFRKVGEYIALVRLASINGAARKKNKKKDFVKNHLVLPKVFELFQRQITHFNFDNWVQILKPGEDVGLTFIASENDKNIKIKK